MDSQDIKKIRRCNAELQCQHDEIVADIEELRRGLLDAEDEVRRRRSRLEQAEKRAVRIKKDMARTKQILSQIEQAKATLALINRGELPGLDVPVRWEARARPMPRIGGMESLDTPRVVSEFKSKTQEWNRSAATQTLRLCLRTTMLKTRSTSTELSATL
ncbi:hypothetical protein DACRYDRAFT_106238 [Dacryopinax primogenitus]|uniref:Uncharacterized protein n=1 Tax=Dacryopinax primogenitus (strain DJM 731) TaxID=1858805 RepID=M5G4A8_DACPD|nr:uncharacterized protein DACRYDRAFT_106238 [Dacryopinax primogenitus]EJU03060.1 hypothetical protein DACRYDRAFT_106238 [Dacryopinax primogenitus]